MSRHQSSTFDSICGAGSLYESSHTHSTSVGSGLTSGFKRLFVPSGILPQLPGSKSYSSRKGSSTANKSYSSTASTCEPSSPNNRNSARSTQSTVSTARSTQSTVGSVSFLTDRANKRVGEYSEIARVRDRETEGSQSLRRGQKGNDEKMQHGGNIEQVSAEFQSILAGVLGALGREGDAETITISSGETKTNEYVKNSGHKYYKVPVPPRPVQVRFEIWKKQATALVNIWASTDDERPSSKNHQLKARDDGITYQHVLPDSIGVTPGGVAPPCNALFICVEGATEATYDCNVTFSAVKVQLSKEQLLQQRIQASKTTSVVEQRIQELQQNTEKRHQFEEDLVVLKRKRAEEMGESRFIQIRNAKEVVAVTRLKKNEELRQSALARQHQQEVVKSRHAQVMDNLKNRRIMWVQREQTRRREREEQQRIREEAESNDHRVKYFLTSLSMVCFAVNLGQQYKRKLDFIAQRERENNAAGRIGAEFLKFWSCRRRTSMYRNIVILRAGLIAFTRQAHLCVCSWAAPVIKDFITNRLSDDKTSGNVTMQIKAFVLKIRRVQKRWRRIKTIRSARVQICMPFMREMEDEIMRRRTQNKGGDSPNQGEQHRASITGRTSGRGSFLGNPLSRITGGIAAAPVSGKRSSISKRRASSAQRMDEELEEEALLSERMPDHIVQSALYTYFVQRQYTYHEEMTKWQELMKEEDLEAFTMTEQEIHEAHKDVHKPSPLDPCMVRHQPAQYDRMFQLAEETRLRWEMQVLKDAEASKQENRPGYMLAKRKSTTDS